MPRRYQMGADGEMHPAYFGRLPEQFTEADTLHFMADTDIQLSGTVSADTLAAIKAAGYEYRDGDVSPVPGKENHVMSDEKSTGAQAPAQEAEKPAPLKLDVTARAIDPIKNLVGFATVKLNDCFVVEDFKILTGSKGLYVGMPSKPDKSSPSGYRETVKPITADFRKELHGAILGAYEQAVEKLQTRAAAARQAPPPEKQSIKEQLEAGAKQAAKENAERPQKEKPKRAKAAKAAER
ncbi:septation protein SpoVG family protein [Bariatricus massiliensis]|uniref:Septation protein SpoVG family protein n=1 Tax=Bariatricus massiliensis TaxID=1745713 RepID=A0ABS8DBE6_9FIRM|nr:septation protein SpoVG family protein [Bariatricus massiliensis]MCB7303661.1 septation protein SpoVG family protein [Bariatricus massiliensis]MCB7373077.1 septation protein SpoVG family protein [Bariatricus massiliensis]MCB7385747.1 septation protein SpoVG family protein [Bariatricus massiliensis]MCB7409909.1 septation protein SpoVG family protein [Bariatricus massiliensis]MCQ5253122.1 septation protein SpoVG family protein [Bariatricus massiliensis]